MVARILAMIAEQRSIKLILDELLGATGNSLLIVHSSWIVREHEKVSFWTVAKRVARRNAVLIGYQETGSVKTTFLNPEHKNEAYLEWEHLDLAIIGGNRPVEGYSNFGVNEMLQVDAAETPVPGGTLKVTGGVTGWAGTDTRENTPHKQRTNLLDAIVKHNKPTMVDAAPLLDAMSHTKASDEEMEIMNFVMQTPLAEGGTVKSAAHSAMKLSVKFWLLMNDAEQQRFGSALERLGERVKNGSVPAKSKGGGASSKARSRSRSPGNA